jgi:hypothetical protein
MPIHAARGARLSGFPAISTRRTGGFEAKARDLGFAPKLSLPKNPGVHLKNPVAGGIFARMFHLYDFDREEYPRHYHLRSNVESTFSMVKAKFGDSLRSKTDAAMVNESLCKLLCHNLCCLILSAYELGIEAKFWGNDGASTAVPTLMATEDEGEAWAWV